jgi:hypothetical protein
LLSAVLLDGDLVHVVLLRRSFEEEVHIAGSQAKLQSGRNPEEYAEGKVEFEIVVLQV